jgi:hypothetical protein
VNDERKLVRLSEVAERPLTWVWPGYVAAGAITDLSGDPAAGKSRIAYDLTARITTGQPLPGCTEGSPAAGVVLLQGEDTVDTMVKPALAAAGADLERVFVCDPSQFGTQPLALPEDLKIVKDAAAQVAAKLVVIDPASVFFTCNANSDGSVRQALKPLVEFAEEAELAVLLVRHLNKASRTNLQYQAMGSIAWLAAARCGLRVMNDPTSTDPYRHLLVLVKTNLSSVPSLAYRTVMANGQLGVEWLGTSNFTAKDLTRGEFEDGSKLWEAMEILFLILRDGPAPAEQVHQKARREGVAKRTLERAKAAMRVRSELRVISFDWYWQWKLPQEGNPIINHLRQKYDDLDGVAEDCVAQEEAEIAVGS